MTTKCIQLSTKTCQICNKGMTEKDEPELIITKHVSYIGIMYLFINILVWFKTYQYYYAAKSLTFAVFQFSGFYFVDYLTHEFTCHRNRIYNNIILNGQPQTYNHGFHF